MLENFLPPDWKPVSSPTTTQFKMLRSKTPNEPSSPPQYNQLIGSLLWVSQCSQPNISFAVNKLSQFLQDPSLGHWEAVIRLLSYLCSTRSLKLTLGGKTLDLSGYLDLDWAEDRENRRSTSGYAFCFGSGVISWKSKKQLAVLLSSTKAKYKAMSDACKEGLWLSKILSKLHLCDNSPVNLFVNNKGAEALSKNPEHHSCTKHIDARHHFIRKCVGQGVFKAQHASTSNMLADMLTKPLPRVLLRSHQLHFGLLDCAQKGGVLE